MCLNCLPQMGHGGGTVPEARVTWVMLKWQRAEPKVQRLSAQAYLIYDCNSGQVLLSRKANQKREVASITKMMTFYTALKLIERFHSFLHTYGHSMTDELT